jgi:aminopeptidase YwaD
LVIWRSGDLVIWVLILAMAVSACATAPRVRQAAADRLPPRAEQAIDVILSGFDQNAAMEHVEFMSQYWRLAGNDGFDQSLDRLYERLLISGFAMDRRGPRGADSPPASPARIHSYPNDGHGWDHTEGTLTLLNRDGTETRVLSRERERLALCINSFPTPAGGLLLDLIDVGRGDRAGDYEGKDVKGALVLGDAGAAGLWREATSRGAAGIISTALPGYIRPTPPGVPEPTRDEWDILQWSAIPYDKARQSFGFKASPRAAATLRRALAQGPARVRVTIASSFSERDARMLIAELPGSRLAGERIVIAAHVQEPGANDNASGSATLVELAAAMQRAISAGRLPPPVRTITFLWIDEIAGSRQWIKDHPTQAKQVRWMFSLDMTGEDVTKTGGSFLVERWPDPGAVYDRAWDPHSEWGRSEVDPKTLKGDLINDLHLAVARRVAARTGWVVRSNPYEGGSDHTVFGALGVPSLLDWHFTDRYYHTNFDTPDKVRPAEMRNVAAAVGATAWLMASATSEEARRVASLVEAAGRARLRRERAERAKDRDVAVAAWTKWYEEAVASAARLPTDTQAQGVSVEALILAEDRRASSPGDYELLSGTARSHPDARMRARAVRALGRLEQSLSPAVQPADLIERALEDHDPLVRRTAAYALAQSVSRLDAAAKAPRRARLLARIAEEPDDLVASVMMESAARLADPASIGEVEAAVLAQAARPGRADGAAYALDVLVRRTANRTRLGPSSLAWLRQAAAGALLAPGSRRAAMQALIASGGLDASLADRLIGDADWQIRRLVVIAAADTSSPALSNAEELIARGLADLDAHVRRDAVWANWSRLKLAGCEARFRAVSDADAHVSLTAIQHLKGCVDPRIASALEAFAASPGGMNWHQASYALATLGSVDSGKARALLPAHVRRADWPVRMHAANAAAVLEDDDTLERLAGDPHPNVRERAVSWLQARATAEQSGIDLPARRERLKRVVLHALEERRDPQLLRTAAQAVVATGDPAAFKDALLAAIAALDAVRADTTVDARVALLDALKRAAPAEPDPPAPSPRAPETPSVEELQTLPTRGRIEMARGGTIELEFLPDEAPAAVARFARLARAGYYDGLTFHRVVPNFVIQGGSPWANEYAGAARFQRDEIGFARHERGAVGISTRGRDTGDAQIFIDIVDLPRLNHEYTVFARVVSGMDVVDRVLEADVIRRIAIVR